MHDFIRSFFVERQTSPRRKPPHSTMEARNRRPAPAKDEPAEPIKKVATETSSSGFSVLDVLRVVGGILLFSSGLSYLSTSGTSLTWGYNPWWTRAREWANIFVRILHGHSQDTV